MSGGLEREGRGNRVALRGGDHGVRLFFARGILNRKRGYDQLEVGRGRPRRTAWGGAAWRTVGRKELSVYTSIAWQY